LQSKGDNHLILTELRFSSDFVFDFYQVFSSLGILHQLSMRLQLHIKSSKHLPKMNRGENKDFFKKVWADPFLSFIFININYFLALNLNLT